MLIVPGPASTDLAQRTAKLAGLRTVALESKIFPDGDSYLRFRDSVEGQEIAVIQSTYYPQDRNLIQLMMLIDGLRDLGCSSVYVIVPYLSYMRQDKRFLEGEVVTSNLILNLMRCCKVDQLMTINIHNPQVLAAYRRIGSNLDAMPLLADWIKAQGVKAPLIVAPDKGADEHARTVSRLLGTDYAVGMKTRDRHTGAVTVEFDSLLKPSGRQAVIVDDLIARGDTVIKTTELLLKLGATSVTALCVHGQFLDNAIERMEAVGVKEVVSTDTIPSAKSKISVAPVIVEALKPLSDKKAHD